MLKRSDLVQLVSISAMILAGVWVVLELPSDARVPIHFDSNGTPNGWAGTAMAMFMTPALAVMFWGLQWLLPKIDPRGDNLVRSAVAVSEIFTALTVVLTVVQGVIVAAAMGVQAPNFSLGLVLPGGLLVVIGNVLGKLRPNYSVGIRTPWTLDNERVWDQTHRFGGKISVLGGVLLCLLAALPMEPTWQVPAIVVVCLVCAVASVLKSYLLWRAQKRSGHSAAPG